MARNRKRRAAASRNPHPRSTDDTSNADLVEKSTMHNERFTAYYKAQKIIPEEEWQLFLDALRQPLPTAFRVAGNRQFARELNNNIKNIYIPSLKDAVFESEAVPPPVQIPWYPDGLAWQFNIPKKILRKSPEFKKFHSFLVFETDVGNISRQEAVSMLPPLFLEVEPHHVVMDMCAAPGSKTAQLLESLHAQDTVTSASIPTGLLIANDSDYKRTHLLIHQSARLPSPAFMVTNLDASIYPIIKVPSQPRLDGREDMEQLLFDRILCDVPCSGDGTLRKNLGIWKNWQPMDGNGLHSLQLRILQRAMKMLKMDGRIVYSTCSLNPVENEAVIAAALKSNPEFELVDVSEKLPELKRRPGINVWRPTIDRDVTTAFDSYHDFVKSLTVGEPGRAELNISEGHWPPSDVEDLRLTRCLRIYAHLQDTGAFFIAVLERKRHASPSGEMEGAHLTKRVATESPGFPDPKKRRVESPSPNLKTRNSVNENLLDEDAGDLSTQTPIVKPLETNSKGKKKSAEVGAIFKENPFTYLDPDDPILQSCIKGLNLTSDFPSSNVLVRNPAGKAARSLYLTNDMVKNIVLHNDYNRIRLTSCGTKVFTKQEGGKGADAQFRVLGEGLPVVLPYTDSTSIITADISVLKTLLEVHYPLCATFRDPFRSAIAERALGGYIIRFPLVEDGRAIHDLVLPIWRSNVSVTLMIDKKAKRAMSLRLFGMDISAADEEFAEKQTSVVRKPQSFELEGRSTPSEIEE